MPVVLMTKLQLPVPPESVTVQDALPPVTFTVPVGIAPVPLTVALTVTVLPDEDTVVESELVVTFVMVVVEDVAGNSAPTLISAKKVTIPLPTPNW